MSPRRAQSAVAIAVVALLATLVTGPTAYANGRHIDGSTDPDGATVHVVDGSVSGGSGGGAPGGCARRYVPTDLLVYKFHFDLPEVPLAIPAAPSLLHQAFDIYCGDTYLTTVWAIPSAAAAVIGEQTARELLAARRVSPGHDRHQPGARTHRARELVLDRRHGRHTDHAVAHRLRHLRRPRGATGRGRVGLR